MGKKHPKIMKSNGEIVPFDPAKLKASLLRAGASKGQSRRVLEQVKTMLFPEITTEEIYRNAYDLLKLDSDRNAGRYKLKHALMELGTSGFPFERFVGALMESQGYQVEFDAIWQGKCVRHELDVIATKSGNVRLVECKYHSQRGQKTDVKIALYVSARMMDLEANLQLKHPQKDRHFQPWLITNTRFSDDAMTYGRCAGMHLVAWDYPGLGSLREMVETSGLFPITCLAGLSAEEKCKLAEQNIILCRELEHNVPALLRIGLSDARIAQVLDEAAKILSEAKPRSAKTDSTSRSQP